MKEEKLVCYGRDGAVAEIITSARRNGSVLLFGGRQAGKTTLLRKLTEVLSKQKADISELSDIDLPVYVDLMRLPYDAKPSNFFYLLISEAKIRCAEQISGFQTDGDNLVKNDDLTLESFCEQLRLLKNGCQEVNVHLMFLLDESKRVLGDRFPRGFQDNLFTLLYGETASSGPKISMIFCGGQHLYKFAQDDTSPIGSRAGYVYVKNLPKEIVLEMINAWFPGLEHAVAGEVTNRLAGFTGGHAGLVLKMLNYITDIGKCEGFLSNPVCFEENLFEHNLGLFENWALSLTNECRTAWEAIEMGEEISISKIAGTLNRRGFDRFLAQRTLDELQYMGLASRDEKKIYKVNAAFATFTDYVSTDEELKPLEKKSLWQLIEQTELALRDVINKKFVSSFSEKSETMMASILGKDTWDKIEGMKAKSAKSYPYSRTMVTRDSLSCMYFGDLMSLMISNKTWSMFKHMFKDKRHIEDIIKAIVPVRNDSAHFSQAPNKELTRCEINCDDLLVIVEREADTMAALQAHSDDAPPAR